MLRIRYAFVEGFGTEIVNDGDKLVEERGVYIITRGVPTAAGGNGYVVKIGPDGKLLP